MLTWLLQRIGIEDTLANRVAEAEWLWARPGLFWLALVLLLPIAVFVVLRHRQSLSHLSPGQRGVLTCCRMGVLALLVFVLGGPYLRLEESVTRKPAVAVMVDASDSMALPVGNYQGQTLRGVAMAAGLTEPGEDGEAVDVPAEARRELANMTRGELLDRIWSRRQGELFEPMHDRFELRGYRFAGRLRSAALATLAEPNESADATLGSGTAVGGALRDVLDDLAARPVAGLLLLSDGQTNVGPDPLDTVRELGDPPRVWTVPIGSGERLLDVSLLDVLAPGRVTRGDTASVVATIASHGFVGREVQVRLRDGDDVLDERSVTLDDDARQQVTLGFEADEPGMRLLNVEVDRLSEEQVAENNEQTLAVEVDETQWEVLYLEGYPRWDFRYLDHALRRDRGLSVRMVMEAQLRARDVSAEELPAAAGLPEDVEGWAEHHAVILGDVSAEMLPRRYQEQLALAVRERGVGLIVQAGPEHMPHAFADGPLAELLPVRLAADDDDGDDGRGGWQAPAFAPYRMQVTPTGSIHPALRLYEQASRNRQVWSQMPPFYWSAAVGEPRAGTTVLADLDAAERSGALLAEHFAGRGRVMFIGTDATYRWRRNIGDHLFYRFWGQALRHVARATDRDGDASWLAVHPPRVEPGEAVHLELYAVDDAGMPLTDEHAEVRITRDEFSETVDLVRSGSEGVYRGQWRSDEPGEFEASHSSGEADERVTARVRVAASGHELLRPDVNRDTLGNLAESTGGELLELDELDRLIDQLQGEATTFSRVHEQEVWDNWFTLLLLVSLYCTDVFVRRMAGVS